jgi:hypothetical protein
VEAVCSITAAITPSAASPLARGKAATEDAAPADASVAAEEEDVEVAEEDAVSFAEASEASPSITLVGSEKKSTADRELSIKITTPHYLTSFAGYISRTLHSLNSRI